jgi:dienelactone hydrolase
MLTKWFFGFVGCLFITLAQAEPTSRPSDTQPTKVIEMNIPASLSRPLKSSSQPEVARLLKDFSVSPQAFHCQMRSIGENDNAHIWRVTFPSPYVSPDPINNTVWCEYYRSKVVGPRPAVILLHPLDLRISLMRTICEKMTQAGMDCLWLEMAYYDRRAPGGIIDLLGMINDLERLKSAVRQTVMDVRRASEFLAGQPDVLPKKIYLMGCSLGALVSGLTMGVDGEFSKVVLLVGGADIAQLMTANEKNNAILAMINKQRGLTQEKLRDQLKPIEPLTYLDRARDVKVLMINNRGDTVIIPECSQKMADKLPNATIKWFDGNHAHLPMDELIPLITDFYKGK